MNLIVSGSVYSLMNKIFQNNKEPLFGRADNIIELSPFSLPVLREIIHDYHPTYTNDDLLALYTNMLNCFVTIVYWTLME